MFYDILLLTEKLETKVCKVETNMRDIIELSHPCLEESIRLHYWTDMGYYGVEPYYLEDFIDRDQAKLLYQRAEYEFLWRQENKEPFLVSQIKKIVSE